VPIVADHFISTAIRFPDRVFLVAAYSQSVDSLSYGLALRRARGFAARLEAAGVKPGDRVVLNCPNSLDYACVYFGIWLMGATIVPVDPRSRPAHVNRVYDDCQARCIIVPHLKPEFDPALRQIPLAGMDWTINVESVDTHIPNNPLALIIYTSGTTGTPKGVCLSHANLEHTRQSIASWARVTANDRELTTLSLTHLFGLAHLHVYCTLGATMYIEEGLKDIPRLLDTIERSEITSFPATPAGLKIMIDHFPELVRQKARRLRYMIINTAPMPVDYTRKLLALLPETDIFMYYGLTEASRSTYFAYREHVDKLHTVGRATPGAAIAIGSPVKPLVNQPGEILVTGPHVTAGYWNQNSGDFFESGWFRTGDLGVIDDDGFLTWLGRVREQINVNGLKLVPAEVEDVLRQEPRVKDCAVVGVPDPATGEAVVAFVVADESVDAKFELFLRKLCSRQLEDYKVPRRIVFVDEIPKTDSGKVKRLLLRDRLRPPT
jgi:long-chain acyl-CoA synthetase